MAIKIEGLFKAAAKPKGYGTEGKSVTKFYVDIEVGSDYPSVAEFSFFGDKLDLSNLKAGEPVEVFFNISGRKSEYQKDGKTVSGFFQSLVAFRIASTAQRPAPQQPATQLNPQQAFDPNMDSDNLPF